MDKQILLIASSLLELAANQFSNHGCNDLSKNVLKTILDKESLLKDIRKRNGEDDFPTSMGEVVDWQLMYYIGNKLKEEFNK